MARGPMEPLKLAAAEEVQVKSRRQPALLFVGLLGAGAAALFGASFLSPEQVSAMAPKRPIEAPKKAPVRAAATDAGTALEDGGATPPVGG